MILRWYNLKKNKCPQCGRDFVKGLTVESNMTDTLFTHPCGFKIREQRYKEIISGMIEKDIENQDNEQEN